MCGAANLAALRSIGIGAGAQSDRLSSRKQPHRDPHEVNKNSWERGIARDERGMPYLDEHFTPVGVKEFAERRNSGVWDYPGKRVSSPPVVGRKTAATKGA